jgi:glucuronoarabinoxylan endo-1,4-beta-xylanase
MSQAKRAIGTMAALLLLTASSVWGAMSIDVTTAADRSSASATVSTPVFSTASGNESLLALVATDYQSGANMTVQRVAWRVRTWSISGTISPSAAGSGAMVVLSGTSSATVTAGSSGNYTFAGLGNGSYTVTPRKSGYTFSPPSQAVSITGANRTGINFTGATTVKTWSISGTISPSAAGSGATVALSGTSSAAVNAGSSGNYTFTGLGNGSYTVTPSKGGYAFSPPSQAVTMNGANLTGINFTGSTFLTINWTDVRQPIDGFGASSAFITDTITDAQADMFFSPSSGIGLSFLRDRIAPDGTSGRLSVAQQAVARGVRVWSTPWSPPAAWKDNNNVNNGGHLLASHYQDYANQLATYVVNMAAAGIPIYAISVQNEPDLATSYESAVWTAQQIHDFIPYLYSALAANGVSSTKVLIAEQSGWAFDLTSAAMSDPATAGRVGIVAAHGYNGTIGPVNTQGKPLWQTEVSTFNDTYDGSMSNALTWAAKIHQFMTTAQVNAWHYWWVTCNCAPPDTPDNEGLTDQAGNPAKRMYALGNFSKFVRPGFYRIGVTNTGGLLVSAYKDPASGNFAIVAVNPSSATSPTFALSGFTATAVTPWITSSTLSLVRQPAVAVTNSSFTYTVPASSVVTFVGQAN